MKNLKGYRMPIFDDEMMTEQDRTEEKKSNLKSFYLAVFSCNTMAYPNM